jgi:hypothetical protein
MENFNCMVTVVSIPRGDGRFTCLSITPALPGLAQRATHERAEARP